VQATKTGTARRAPSTQAETEVVYLGQPPLRVDLLCAIDGVATTDVLARAVPITWEGTPLRVIALDDLITNKRAAGRPQDIADVARLERIRLTKGD
jgi:predicted nucleotidyltransferase